MATGGRLRSQDAPVEGWPRRVLSNTFDPRSPEKPRTQRLRSRIDIDDRGKEFLIASRFVEVPGSTRGRAHRPSRSVGHGFKSRPPYAVPHDSVLSCAALDTPLRGAQNGTMWRRLWSTRWSAGSS